MKTIFLVGPHASGKTYSTKEVIKKMNLQNVKIIDTGPIMRGLHKESAPDKTIDSWIDELEKQHGKGITSELICNEIKKRIDKMNNDDYAIVIGFRTVDGLKHTIESLGLTDYNILYVEASFDLLYQNYCSREGNKKTREEFAKYLEEELQSGLGLLRTFALDNNSRIDYFYRTSNNDGFENCLLHYLSPNKEMPRKEINMATYIWPIEPTFKLLEHDKYGLRKKHMILGTPRFHSGHDITARTLTPVNASIDGIVVRSGLDEKIASGSAQWNERYGNKVELLDRYGRITLYAHLRDVLVNEGDYVTQGQQIGLSGCSGGSRIPHVHFEVRKTNTLHSGKDNTINPLLLLPEFDLEKLEKHFDEEPYAEIWEKVLNSEWEITDDDIWYAKNKIYIR